MMPRLRGHHLICLHFFSGEGYDRTFIENLQATLETVLLEGVQIVAGGDNICIQCPYLKEDSCQTHVNADGEIREMDNKALALLGLSVGHSVAWDSIKKAIPGIFAEWFRCCCAGCEWLQVCEKNDDFRKVRPGGS